MTCTITVTFTPTAVGTRTAQVTITDSSPSPGSTQVVDLTGTGGNEPLVSLSATSLAFGNQAVGVASSSAEYSGDEHRHRAAEFHIRRRQRRFCGSGQ